MLVLLSLFLISCAKNNKIILHPMNEKDFYYRDNGDACFSPKFFEESLGKCIDVSDIIF